MIQPAQVDVTLAFSGGSSNQALIDFYDVSQALIGFQRSLALTTHLVLNGEIITQAPSLKGARIYVAPPEYGSWKIPAYIVMGATGLYHLGTAPKDTPLGHIVFSVYNYVVSETLGGNVDYNKSLGQIYEEAQKEGLPLKPVTEGQADSLIEKCSTAIKDMHRPIAMTGTANAAAISISVGASQVPLSTKLSISTFEFMNETRQSQNAERVVGRISSYNSNTFKGRIYIKSFGRPVGFEIAQQARTKQAVQAITTSLHLNANGMGDRSGALVSMVVFRLESKAGHLKSLLATAVAKHGEA